MQGSVVMSADLSVLRQIHQKALAGFAYLADAMEHWMSPDEIRAQIAATGHLLGDCDDFAALCVMQARQVGLPARFVLCLTETREPHLCAEVDGWVLCNRQRDVIRRDDLAYTWIKVSGFVPGEGWRAVK
jgi:predicted transglutaminase-like cysteine proteinase